MKKNRTPTGTGLMRFINNGYLQSINTHPTQGESLHGKVYDRVPDPFSPPSARGTYKK